ncbi:hypothetical protein [Treponema sp. R80B11-R83G3]
MYKEVSDRVDWAAAPKLDVRMEYPSDWGTSNPPQGSITMVKDIRKGYEFSVEFTPDTAYTLKSWLAYPTDKLNELGNWLEDTSLITTSDNLTLKLGEIILPEVTEINARGGTFTFTINITDPVTIIPWCEMPPRITRAEPRTATGASVSRASAITIYFTSALNNNSETGTVKFATIDPEADNVAPDDIEKTNGIWIEAVLENGDGATQYNYDDGKFLWYEQPKFVAESGFFMITITPKSTLPPGNSKMTVKVKGIKDIDDAVMDGIYSFSWITKGSSDIDFWSAEYNSDSGSIDIDYSVPETYVVRTYYRLDGGSKTEFTGKKINSVSGPGYSGIREGRQASGIQEYEIIVELYEDDALADFTSFKIWNIPGMSTKYDTRPDPVIDDRIMTISTAAELAAMKDNLSGQYVLSNDINVTGDWAPIGKFDNDNPKQSFTGKFYGNGHTVTLNGGFSGELLCYGLFGCAQNAVIRDFTLEYKNPSPITPDFGFFSIEMQGATMTGEGIIIGSVAGFLIKTEVCNIITSGRALAVDAPASNALINIVAVGGIAGMIEGEGRIENCRAALSTAYTSKGHTGEVNTGAIAGTASKVLLTTPNPEDSGLILNGVTIVADVSANKGSYGGGITIGGAFGGNTQITLSDIKFTAGKTVSVKTSDSIAVCGGIVGSFTKGTMEGCLFLGNIDFTGATEGGRPQTIEDNICIGGLAGRNDDGNEDDEPGIYDFNDCQIRGNINFRGVSIGPLTVGGIFGTSNKYVSDSIINITDCFFEGGEITMEEEATAPFFAVGGFIGTMGGGKNNPDPAHNINNSGTLQGQISINNVNGAVEVGGFTSHFTGTISKCFSKIDINVKSKNSGLCSIGGFIGILYSNASINSCYATGNVSVIAESVDKGQQMNYSSSPPSVGGLVGNSKGTIDDSYALGNVVLSDSGNFGTTSAGGLVGRIDNDDSSSSKIAYCFSAGRVSAQSKYTVANSGGITGFITRTINNTIQNTAALSASVTARGDTKFAARICGSLDGDSISPLINNYALKSMAVKKGAYNDTDLTDVTLSVGLNAKDGADTASSAFLNQAFWSTTLSFTSVWDFSRVARDGYPRLAWEK